MRRQLARPLVVTYNHQCKLDRRPYGALGRNLMGPLVPSRPAAVGCTSASIEVVQVAVAPQTVIEEDDADSDIEAYHPDPHPGLDRDQPFSQRSRLPRLLTPGSGASAVQREAAEEALSRCDLPPCRR